MCKRRFPEPYCTDDNLMIHVQRKLKIQTPVVYLHTLDT